MNKLVLLCFVVTMFTSNCVVPFAQEASSSRGHSQSSSMEYASYIEPHNNYREEVRNIIRFKLQRWTFRPISLALQATAGGFLIGSQCCINRYPEIAKVLTGVSLGISASSFAINALLLNVDFKLEDLNNRTTQRQQNDIYPAIIQR